MLKIANEDVVSITQIENAPGYDPHSYNTFIYWPNKLEHIQNKLSQIKKAKQFYKVTQDDGTVQYLTDTELDLLKKDVIIS